MEKPGGYWSESDRHEFAHAQQVAADADRARWPDPDDDYVSFWNMLLRRSGARSAEAESGGGAQGGTSFVSAQPDAAPPQPLDVAGLARLRKGLEAGAGATAVGVGASASGATPPLPGGFAGAGIGGASSAAPSDAAPTFPTFDSHRPNAPIQGMGLLTDRGASIPAAAEAGVAAAPSGAPAGPPAAAPALPPLPGNAARAAGAGLVPAATATSLASLFGVAPGTAGSGATSGTAAAPNATLALLDHPDLYAGAQMLGAHHAIEAALPVVAKLSGGDKDKGRALLSLVHDGLSALLPPDAHGALAATCKDCEAKLDRALDTELRAKRRGAVRTVLDREAAHATARHDDAAWSGDANTIAAARHHAVDLARAGARARGLTPAAADAEADRQRAGLAAREQRIALSRKSNAELQAIAARGDEPQTGGGGDGKSSAAANSATQNAAALAKSIIAEREADPARSGERDIERDIADAKERGEIQTEAEEHQRRFDLRRQAQDARGIPPERQRLLTEAEYSAIKEQYEALPSRDRADAWLADHAAPFGPHADAVEAEFRARHNGEAAPSAPTAKYGGSGKAETQDGGGESDPPTGKDSGSMPPRESESPDPPERRYARHLDAAREQWRKRAEGTTIDFDSLYDHVLARIAEIRRIESPAAREAAWNRLAGEIHDRTVGTDPDARRLYADTIKGARFAIAAPIDGDPAALPPEAIEDAFLAGAGHGSPIAATHAELAEEEKRAGEAVAAGRRLPADDPRLLNYRRDAETRLHVLDPDGKSDIDGLRQRIVSVAMAARGLAPAERAERFQTLKGDLYAATEGNRALRMTLVAGAEAAFSRAAALPDATADDLDDAFLERTTGTSPRRRAAEAPRPDEDPLRPDEPGTIPPEAEYSPEVPNPIPVGGVSRKREVRALLTQMYRVGARTAEGGLRLSDAQFDEYLAEARRHIEDRHFPIFELTARAVREGVLPWTVAAERLRDYFVPESTGESIADFVLDLAPIVGQVKSAAEAYAHFEAAAQAAAFGDHETARLFALKGSAALAGVLPAAKFGALNRLIAANKVEWHHVYPVYLGGLDNGPTEKLRRYQHHELHRRLQTFLRRDETTKGMAHAAGYSRTEIAELFAQRAISAALDKFYRTQLSEAHYKAVVEAWLRMFPEIGKYTKPR